MISVDIVITCDFPHTNIVSLICVIQTCAFKKINLKQKNPLLDTLNNKNNKDYYSEYYSTSCTI